MFARARPRTGKKLAAAALALLLVSLAPASAHGQELHPVRVGLYQNPPKVFIDDDGRPAGLFIELIERIARQNRWQLEYAECRWNECLAMLETGEIDLMPDVALTAARNLRLTFHEIPVVQSWSQVYARPRNRFTAMTDLQGTAVAVLSGSVQAEFLERLNAEQELDMELIHVDSFGTAFELAGTGKADAAAANHFFGRRNSHEYDLIETPITFNQTSLYFAASSNAAGLLPAIDNDLQRWKRSADSPYYQALNRTYAAPARVALPDWLIPALTAAVLAFMALSAWLLVMRRRMRLAQQRLEHTNQRLNHLLVSAPVVLYSLRVPEMTVEWVSPNAERLTGFPHEEASRDDWWPRHVHPEDKERIEAENQSIRPDRTLVQEYRVTGRDGETLVVRDEKRFIPDHEGAASGVIIGCWNDVTAARRQARQVDFLSHHDRLTALPNRARLEWLLENALAGAAERRQNCFVVLADLDRFKSVNDQLGVATGDRILKLITSRLLSWTLPDDVVGRFGNDEFCIVTTGTDYTEMQDRLAHLVAEIATPTPVADRDLMLTASVGVARYPRDGTRPETLLQRASQALQEARSQGGNRWIEFGPEIATASDTSPFLESDMRQAIRDHDLELFYQPQVTLGDNVTVAVEALVRWNHPEHGMLTPSAFVPLAEQTGLVEELDLWMIRQACRQLAAWRDSGFGIERVSVNLSTRQRYNRALPAYIQSCLDDAGLAPRSLTLELTETMLMESPERAREVLQRIRSSGVRISMDDFGTGYSNLAYITQLPIDEVKIDQSLVRDLGRSAEAETLMRGMIVLFERLGLKLVAEGIETAAQRDFLIRAGCTNGQGFLLGPPVSPDQLFRRTDA